MMNFNFKKNMKEMSMEILLITMLIYSILWAINSNSWFIIWICMEINSMMFIPLMLNKSYLNNSMYSMIKYFIIQSFSSTMFLFMIILFSLNNINWSLNFMIMLKIILLSSLIMKLGASPFHWWIPLIMKKISWSNCFFIMTIQKIIPMIMIIQLNLINSFMFTFSLLSSVFISSIMGLNQTLIKLIMSFSSINHIGWMLMCMKINLNLLITYFFIYFLNNLFLCNLMSYSNYNYLNELYSNMNLNMLKKISMISSILSLGGLPPFIGFLPKFFTIMSMINKNFIMESLFMIFFILLTLKYYLYLIIPNLSLLKSSMKWNMNSKFNKNIKLMLYLNILLSFLLIMLINKMNLLM